ncbi:MAG: insulinase family protein [Desulfovibrionaceae bacterium]|nr:insulinase family protein [Desulfovibrionaceae bacterium]
MHPAARALLGALLVIFGAAVSAGAAPVQDIFRLQNGLTVLVREDHRFPLASVRLHVKAGSAWEEPDEAGISHLLEHMVFKGSKTRPEGVDKALESAGGYLNASTSYDQTIYLTDLPAARWKTAMEAVRDLAFDPLLRQADLDAEREVVLAEMKQRGDNPYTKLFHATFARALKGTPYERPVIGFEQTLRAATPDSIRAYIQRRYDPRDMLLVVAGDVRAADVLAEAEALFGGYANRNVARTAEKYEPGALSQGLQVELQKGPWNKAYVSVVFPLPGEGAARLPAADVLARMLGGDDTSLLTRALRLERPVVDDVSASAMSFERVGLFAIMAQLDADRLESFVRDLAGILSRLKAADFSDAEIERAKLNLEDRFFRAQETVSGIADMSGALAFSDPSDPDGARYLTSIRDVNREGVQAVMDAWLRPRAMSVVVLAPEQSGISAAAVTRAVTEAWPAAGPDGRTSAASAGKASGFDAPGAPEVLELGRGRTLILLPDPSLPYVSATLLFPGGDLFVDKDREGLASVAAGVLTSGTRGKSYAEISAYLSDRAAGLGASASTLSFSLSLDAPARYAKDLFELVRDVLTRPAFRQEDVDRVKREHLAAIASQEEEIMGVVSRNLRAFLFPDGAYSLRVGGTPGSVARLTRDDLLAFWRKQAAQPWVLSVAGDFDRGLVMDFAKSLPAPTDKRAESSAPVWAGARELKLTLPGRAQAAYLMLFPTVPVSNPDSVALRLLASCLDGFGGLLFQELREKRSLGYSVSPINWASEDAGFLAFLVIASPENLPAARQAFEDIARQLRGELLPEATLDRAKAMLEAGYYRGLQRRAGRADTAAANVLRGRPLDYARQRLDELKKLTPRDLQAVARAYLEPDRAYTIQVTP